MIVPFAPENVSLEATRLCNLRCIMCPTHAANADPQVIAKYPPYFDLWKYVDIMNQLAELDVPMHIGPQFQGEPLLNQAIYEMVRVAKDRGFATGFSTNAVLLTERHTMELIESGLDSLCISLDAVTAPVFEKIRVGAKFKQVMNNVDTLLRLRKTTPSVCINGVRMPENAHEIDRLVDVWLPKVESVSISNVWNDDGVLVKNYLPERYPCPSLFTNMIVLTNGDVIPCCNPHFDMSMGNAFITPMLDIWQGEAYEMFRRLHTEGRWGLIAPCARCDTWMAGSSKKETENGMTVDVHPFHKIYYKVGNASLKQKVANVFRRAKA